VLLPCPFEPFGSPERVTVPGVQRARLYVTAPGVYEVYLGGQQAGDHVLVPGWTSYDHRPRCLTFDVTHLLAEGRHVLGAMLGDC